LITIIRENPIVFQQSSKVKVVALYLAVLKTMQAVKRQNSVSSRIILLCTLDHHSERKNPIFFKVEGQSCNIAWWKNLVSRIETELEALESYNLVHLITIMRGRALLFFKVKGQGHSII
jgi:hypothetical protein